MLLHLLHRTTFVYAGPVHDSFNEVRLRPVTDQRQTCRRFDLRVRPHASATREYVDYYGNAVHYLDLSPVHTELVIEAESEVQTAAADAAGLPVIRPGAETTQALELYAEFLSSSPHVALEDPRWSEIEAVFAPEGRSDLWTDTSRIGAHVFRTLRYEPNRTTVGTRANDVLTTRCGVCQDFAHVALGFCRTAGIPARYVSGYFLNQSRRPGEIEASHAWIDVYLPGHGWVGFDPTHDRPVDERYVQVATGRDYADIRPISGTYRGSGTREMRVDVTVREAAVGVA